MSRPTSDLFFWPSTNPRPRVSGPGPYRVIRNTIRIRGRRPARYHATPAQIRASASQRRPPGCTAREMVDELVIRDTGAPALVYRPKEAPRSTAATGTARQRPSGTQPVQHHEPIPCLKTTLFVPHRFLTAPVIVCKLSVCGYCRSLSWCVTFRIWQPSYHHPMRSIVGGTSSTHSLGSLVESRPLRQNCFRGSTNRVTRPSSMSATMLS